MISALDSAVWTPSQRSIASTMVPAVAPSCAMTSAPIRPPAENSAGTGARALNLVACRDPSSHFACRHSQRQIPGMLTAVRTPLKTMRWVWPLARPAICSVQTPGSAERGGV